MIRRTPASKHLLLATGEPRIFLPSSNRRRLSTTCTFPGISTVRRRTATRPMLVKPFVRLAFPGSRFSLVRGDARLTHKLRFTESKTATKVISKHQGYDATLTGVDESLKKFGFGNSLSPPRRNSCSPGYPDYIDLFLIHDPVRLLWT